MAAIIALVLTGCASSPKVTPSVFPAAIKQCHASVNNGATLGDNDNTGGRADAQPTRRARHFHDTDMAGRIYPE